MNLSQDITFGTCPDRKLKKGMIVLTEDPQLNGIIGMMGSPNLSLLHDGISTTDAEQDSMVHDGKVMEIN